MQNISESEGLQSVADGDVVTLAQQGNELAFAELMRRHSKRMMQVAMGILRDSQEAEDELQNAWWKAWQHIDGFAGDSKFTTWLTRIVMNQCLMRLRQTQRARFLYLDAPEQEHEGVRFELRDGGATPEEGLGRQELELLLRREIARIPAIWRRALMLRELEELPLPKVAEELGLSLSATKSRLLRGRMELRSRLGEFGILKARTVALSSNG